MSSKDRLLQYLDFKGIKKAQFYKTTGLSNGFLDKNENINSDKVEIMISKYPEINLYWLMLGEGEMIKASDQSVVISAESAELNSMKDDLIASLKKQVVMLEDKVNELQRAPASRDFGSARTPSTLLAADTSPGIPTQSADRAQVPTK